MLPKRDIYKNQTEILRWLESRGHKVVYGFTNAEKRTESHRRRGCYMKLRHDTADEARRLAGAGMLIYECKHCLGFHAANPK